MALTLPLFFSLTYFSIESGHALSVAQKLESVVRDGGRLACKDVQESLLPSGTTANQKVVNDIKNMLKAEGYNTTNVVVAITHAGGPSDGQTFDLADPDNAYQMLKISIKIPYSDVGIFPWSISPSLMMESTLIASRGRSTLSN